METLDDIRWFAIGEATRNRRGDPASIGRRVRGLVTAALICAGAALTNAGAAGAAAHGRAQCSRRQ